MQISLDMLRAVPEISCFHWLTRSQILIMKRCVCVCRQTHQRYQCWLPELQPCLFWSHTVADIVSVTIFPTVSVVRYQLSHDVAVGVDMYYLNSSSLTILFPGIRQDWSVLYSSECQNVTQFQAPFYSPPWPSVHDAVQNASCGGFPVLCLFVMRKGPVPTDTRERVRKKRCS